MNTCIYLRKSRKGDDPDETAAETLRRHREQLLALAQERGLNVVEIKEEIVSGGSIAARPQMRALLSEVEEGRYNAVLVMDIDRLGRGSMIDQGIIGQTFRESETLVITPDKTYDLSDDLDEDYYDFYAFFARKELKQIKKRLQRGKMKSFREGNFVWARPPNGYLKSGRNEISPDPETAEVVRRIFRRYLEGLSMGKIAGQLNEERILTASGCQWSHKTVSAILRNREYVGDVVCGKTKLIRGKAVKQPPENWLILPGRHKGIISEEQFERVQQKLTACPSRSVRKDLKLKNPLSGVLRCGVCGGSMTRKSGGRGKDRLRCARSCPQTCSSALNAVETRLLSEAAACMLPRMRPVPLPSSDKERQHCKTYQLDAEFLIRLLQQADPSDRNAFYKSFLHQVDYFRNRDSDKDSFLLHSIFCL